MVDKEGSNKTQDIVCPGVWTDSYFQSVKSDLKLELPIRKTVMIHHFGSFNIAINHGHR